MVTAACGGLPIPLRAGVQCVIGHPMFVHWATPLAAHLLGRPTRFPAPPSRSAGLTSVKHFHNIPIMETREVVEALAALAQETRLAVYRMLVEAGPAGLPAGEISARLGLPAATASFHLAQLRRAGLLASRSQSRFVIYSADFGRMNELLGFLTDNCCAGESCAPVPQAAKVIKRKAS
ncbi:MAG TPA: metalloregulator ArsR/SmtB family transcription factor [Burkholderiales bacterium]|nr:metalloregulator ArsR/SmtB family transcription factor [Burkholderiales bacterium]